MFLNTRRSPTSQVNEILQKPGVKASFFGSPVEYTVYHPAAGVWTWTAVRGSLAKRRNIKQKGMVRQ